MKKVILSILITLFCSNVFAGKIQHLVFFGDSLSDNGNLYQVILRILPKSPPYFQGRFSNGPTWAENLGKYYYDKYYIDYKIYAWGGATAIWHAPTQKFIAPTNLSMEVDQYLTDNLLKDKSQTLFFIWIGGNDYLFNQLADPEVLTTKVVDNITAMINKLYAQGARHFIVLNVPDLSQIPLAQSGSPDKLHTLSALHNKKLNLKVANLRQQLSEVVIDYVDIFSLFVDVIQNPDKYNQRYNINITDTKTACWPGGYFLKNILSEESVNNDLQVSLVGNRVKQSDPAFDLKEISTIIRTSPSISQAYTVSKLAEQGVMPCDNAEQHLFWDQIHPTQVVHQILAKIVNDNISHQVV